MRFENVVLPAVATALPERAVSSEELEERLAPVYRRLNLRTGRLELMTGIRERRFWEAGTRPSQVAALAGERAIERSGLDRSRIGCLIHASVCRDFMEPATASVEHHLLGLPPTCAAFDLSNACLGFANAMVLLATQIEQGQIEAGIAVAGEDGRPLVDTTIETLLAAEEVSRDHLKAAFASLTIGAGAAAMVLAHRSLSPDSPSLAGGLSRAATEHHGLCHGDVELGRAGPLMQTDSEALLHAGNELAAGTWREFLQELGWTHESVDRVVTHQVGVAHRRLTLGSMGIDPAIDFPTVERLGNIGSVSLPLSLSMAMDEGVIEAGQRVAMLGIGSGLQCLMLGVRT